MLIAGITPEFIVGFAARQLFAAWKFSNKFDVSLTHGFFFFMGGFVSQIGHPIATIEQLQDPIIGQEYVAAIKKVTVSDIWDKSKGGVLSKGVAFTQGLWFITQCLACVDQHLSVTELEIATLAFAVINIFTWLLWWGKPLDAHQPIPIGPVQELSDSAATTLLLHWIDSIGGAILRAYGSYNPVVAASVPTFWSMWNDEYEDIFRAEAFLIEWLVGTVFGAIHCAAWNSDFPSAAERSMWREFSLIVSAIPVLVPAAVFILRSREDLQTNIMIAIALAVPAYTTTFLIILPFIALRALPRGAFTDVNWSVYIPHL
ncbi:hypothetical protein DFH09DRAFT_1314930 [Mycena vulgaris]|nr:hypothetical protein DFH09DRAFT_1314930 [Mycena vulgaris]